MAKIVTISFSDYVYEQYLQTANKMNRSKYIEEMFVKGVNSEIGEYQGVQTKAIMAIKENRAKDEQIANLQRELANVKSRVMNQEKRKAAKEQKIREKAYRESMKRLSKSQLEEAISQ